MQVYNWDYRIEDIISAGKVFLEESDYPLKYSENNSYRALFNTLHDPDGCILVDYTGDTLNGFAVLQRTDECHHEYIGYLNKFYVLPNRRLTKASIRLMKEVTEWFDKRQCVLSFANAMARVGHDAAFIKLLQKFQYQPTQQGTLIRMNNDTIFQIT